MIPAAEGTATTKPIFTDFKDYHTDQDVKFVIYAPTTNINSWENEGTVCTCTLCGKMKVQYARALHVGK